MSNKIIILNFVHEPKAPYINNNHHKFGIKKHQLTLVTTLERDMIEHFVR